MFRTRISLPFSTHIFMRTSAYLGCFLILGLLLLGCSEADTLGDKKPDEVVITGTPTWENGIGRLMQLKCASCHTVPHNKLTPDNTPKDIDLRHYSTNHGIRGADAMGSWITAGILEKEVNDVPRMPLNYATPLTTGEVQALQEWVRLGLPQTLAALQTPVTPATTSASTELQRGAVLYAQTGQSGLSCASCHGPNGNPQASGFTPVLVSPDLRSSRLSGNTLDFFLEQMWNANDRGNFGTGAFQQLPQTDRDALRQFILSLRQ